MFFNMRGLVTLCIRYINSIMVFAVVSHVSHGLHTGHLLNFRKREYRNLLFQPKYALVAQLGEVTTNEDPRQY
jgi:hypothetical protein